MDSETATKVAVCLIGSEQVKVWHFWSLDITLEEAEVQMLELFPRIKRNGLYLKLSYKDSITGIIQVESDADFQVLTDSPTNHFLLHKMNVVLRSRSKTDADRKLISIYFFLKVALHSFAEETEKDLRPCTCM